MRQRSRAFRRPRNGSRKGTCLVGVIALLALTLTSLGLGAGLPSTASNRSSGASHVTSSTSGECSKATALRLIEQQHLNGFGLPDPVAQVLCGPFTGAGSKAMAVTIGAAPTCWPIQSWALFSRTGGQWRLVMQRNAFIDPPLVAVGADIRETAPVFRPGDPRCVPSGGSRAHIWRWNGSRLVAGPWKQATPSKTLKEEAIVFSPLAYGISCNMTDDGSFRGSWVYCWIGSTSHPSRHVKLNLNGQFSVTATTAIPKGLGGRSTPYGTRVTAGHFGCQSLRSGIKCTVIRSGKGFLINRDGVTRVGP